MDKPNIIFILSDDLSYADIGCYGQKHIMTPNIDRLSETGMRFTQAYSAAPICGPSRCGLLTGKHMGHARIREHGQKIPNGEGMYQPSIEKEDYTIGNVMKKAGYRTAAIGKWAIGLEGTDSIPNNKGFDYSFGFYDQVYAHTFYPEYVWENGHKYFLPQNKGFDMTKRYRNNYIRWDEENPYENCYDKNGDLVLQELSPGCKGQNTYDECEKKALKFIDENADSPFFLYYAIQNPHGPLIVPSLEPYTNADMPSQRHKEWASIITRLDTGVGRIIDLLERKGIADDTVILFASDNGYSAWGYFGMEADEEVPFFNHKGPFRGNKFSLDGEGGTRVPLLFHWKNHIPEGVVSDQPVALYDLMATFADIAGTDIPEDTDGISILPTLLAQGNQKQHDYFYWECNHQQSARFKDYKFFREHPSKNIEVYDLSKDIGETEDLASKRPDLVEKALEIFNDAHVDSVYFINPGESDEAHDARLAALNLTANNFTPDDPEREKWIATFE